MPIFDEVIRGGVISGDLVVVSGQTSHGKVLCAKIGQCLLIRSEKKVKVLWFLMSLWFLKFGGSFKKWGRQKKIWFCSSQTFNWKFGLG